MWHRQIEKRTPKVVTGSVLLPLGGLLCVVLVNGLSFSLRVKTKAKWGEGLTH